MSGLSLLIVDQACTNLLHSSKLLCTEVLKNFSFVIYLLINDSKFGANPLNQTCKTLLM